MSPCEERRAKRDELELSACSYFRVLHRRSPGDLMVESIRLLVNVDVEFAVVGDSRLLKRPVGTFYDSGVVTAQHLAWRAKRRVRGGGLLLSFKNGD